MTFNKLAIIILSLFLIQADVLLPTQEAEQTQELNASPRKEEKSPWYKITRNWLLISGATLATVFTGATARYTWQNYKQNKRKKLATQILNQTSDNNLSQLIDKRQKTFEKDLLLDIVGLAKSYGFIANTLSTQEREEELQEIETHLSDYINESSKQELKLGLSILKKIELEDFKIILYSHEIQSKIAEKLR
jgi:hypothetical protein